MKDILYNEIKKNDFIAFISSAGHSQLLCGKVLAIDAHLLDITAYRYDPHRHEILKFRTKLTKNEIIKITKKQMKKYVTGLLAESI